MQWAADERACRRARLFPGSGGGGGRGGGCEACRDTQDPGNGHRLAEDGISRRRRDAAADYGHVSGLAGVRAQLVCGIARVRVRPGSASVRARPNCLPRLRPGHEYEENEAWPGFESVSIVHHR